MKLNPLYTDEFSLLVRYNKLGIVHCTYLGCLCILFFSKIVLSLHADIQLIHGFYCLRKYSFRGFPNSNGNKKNKILISTDV